MLRPHSPSRRDIVTDHAIALIAEEGLAALTVRGLARHIRVTPPALQQWVGPRLAMAVVITATFGQRWQELIWRKESCDHAVALLPLDEDEVGWTRVWLALQELGRTEARVGEVVADVRQAELDLIAFACPELAPADHAAVLALVDGLRVACCACEGARMPVESARAILRAHLDSPPPPA